MIEGARFWDPPHGCALHDALWLRSTWRFMWSLYLSRHTGHGLSTVKKKKYTCNHNCKAFVLYCYDTITYRICKIVSVISLGLDSTVLGMRPVYYWCCCLSGATVKELKPVHVFLHFFIVQDSIFKVKGVKTVSKFVCIFVTSSIFLVVNFWYNVCICEYIVV